MCSVEFLSYYSLDGVRSKYVNSNESEILNEMELEFLEAINLPKTIALMPSKETLKLRKEKLLQRDHVPNKMNQPGAYAHVTLLMFFPCREESELNNTSSRIYLMLWAIWYHLCNLNNVKNIHGGVLLLVKLQAKV